MFVVTVDQRNSRSTTDAVAAAIRHIDERWGATLVLPAERTVGDEFQLVAESASDALSISFDLTRTEQWSVGIGVGTVDEPLSDHARESSGPAFLAARAAVEASKKHTTHLRIRTEPMTAEAQGVGALIDLLLWTRGRRTREGWELYDLLRSGLIQVEAAARLRISPQSASQRARVAGLRVEHAATEALANLMTVLDHPVNGRGADISSAAGDDDVREATEG